jgi:uncharacterized Zn-binding protein involved in type VI secretion
MFPAARIGDPITHDQLVPCGVIGPPVGSPPSTVLVEHLPAATVGCTVICSGVITGGIAHHPPPPTPPVTITKGSTTVMINYMPAARWVPSMDFAACGVFLGDPKLAAVRTVLIGG